MLFKDKCYRVEFYSKPFPISSMLFHASYFLPSWGLSYNYILGPQQQIFEEAYAPINRELEQIAKVQ